MCLPAPAVISFDFKQTMAAAQQAWPFWILISQTILTVIANVLDTTVSMVSESTKLQQSREYLRYVYAFGILSAFSGHAVSHSPYFRLATLFCISFSPASSIALSLNLLNFPTFHASSTLIYQTILPTHQPVFALQIPTLLTALAHLFPVLFSRTYLPQLQPTQVFLPVNPFNTHAHAKTLADGALWFLQWDFYTGVAATLVWGLTLLRGSNGGKLSATAILKSAFLSLVLGPAGAAVAAVWERDERVFSSADGNPDRNR